MQHNPYTPPQSLVADQGANASIKPKAILSLQIFAGLLAMFFTASLTVAVRNLAEWSRIAPVSLTAENWKWYSIRVALTAAAVILVFVPQRRSPFSRWAAAAWLAMMIIAVPLIGPALPDFSTTPADEIAGHLSGMALFMLPSILLLYFAVFSGKARAWFARPVSEAARS